MVRENSALRMLSKAEAEVRVSGTGCVAGDDRRRCKGECGDWPEMMLKITGLGKRFPGMCQVSLRGD